MLTFLQLILKKLPAGYSLSFSKDNLGLTVTIMHNRSRVRCSAIVNDLEIESTDRVHDDLFTDTIITDQVKKIRNHRRYTKTPRKA